MKPERWQVIEELYHSASDLPDAERNSFLQEACGGDQSLLYEVESLIRHGSTSQSVLDTPAMAIMAKAIAADEYKSSAPFLEGTIISHYRILAPIGRGGMGVVYKAEDLKLRRLVALKLLPQFLAADPQALHRFEREAQAASALNHPNICTVYEVDEAEGLHFIAIELLEGETLKERIARGPLEVPEILEIVIEICGALEAAHSAGIIHRDIKPSNIVLMRRGAAKLVDFGVAKRIGPEFIQETEDVLSALPENVDLRLTSPGAAIGTIAYMSPEQASGQEVDTRSDIFSLGAVLYEMTTGKYAFPGKDLADVLRAIQDRQPVPIQQLSPKAPSELIRIANKAMQKDRSRRYQRAADMRADLRGLQARLERWALRRRALMLGVGILTLFALAVSSSLRIRRVHELVLGKSSSSIQRVLPSTRSFVLPPESTTFNLIRDDGSALALSPDGTKLAFSAVDAKGAARIWVRPLGSLTSEVLHGTEGAKFPFWSPDGRWIAFFANGKLKKISLAGGSAIPLCDATAGRGGNWSDRGVIVFTPTTNSALYKIPESGGTPTPITKMDTSIHTTHRWPKFLPDGHHFIYLAVNHFRDASHNGVYLGSIEGERSKLLVPTDADATYASGYLFFLHKDKHVLVAQPFDPTRGQLLGEPHPTVEKVLYDPSIWKVVFDASDKGVMAYQLGDRVTGTQLRWFDRSGKQLGTVGEVGFQNGPVLSSDGRKLLIGRVASQGSYSDLWVYDLPRGVGTRITFDDYDYPGGIWSRPGTRVLFNARGQHYTLYEADSSGAGAKRLILDTGADIWPQSLSPDGRFLLYVQGYGPEHARSRLWVYPMSGNSSPFRLLDSEAQQESGQFSPDGRRVAYTSNESGRDEVYVISFHLPSSTTLRGNAATIAKWRISPSGGHQPRWRHDGRELFYIADDNALMSVPVASRGSSFEVERERVLFRPSPGTATPSTATFIYDVSPDGSKFLINIGTPQETTAPITLVANWLSDFEK